MNGDDGNSGLKPDEPKKTSYQIQQTINRAEPGDTLFFERGSVWYGTNLYVSGISGSAENPIVFSAYGEGKNPVLSGQKILENPERKGNIYTFYDIELPSPYLPEKSYGRRFLGYVTIGKQVFPPSRHPDHGFFRSTKSNRLYLTDDQQTWETNQWKDGWVAMKNRKWQWSVARILSNEATTIDYTEHSSYNPSGEKFYCIWNAYQALDRNGEWYWTSDSLSIYWDQGALPVVKASIKNEILRILNSNYLHFDHIDFVGANTECVKVQKSDYNKFDHCRFIGAGEYGFYILGNPCYPPAPGDSENNVVINCEVADCGLGGLVSRYARGGLLANNHIHRIALHPGYYNQYEGSGVGGYALAVWNNLEIKPVVKQNLIESVAGGISSHYNNDALSIRENLVRNYGLGELSDMGGIYVVTDNLSVSTRKSIHKNFFLDVKAPLESQENTYGDSFIHAVYLDQDTYGVKADSNSIENADYAFKTNGGKGRSFSYNKVLHPVTNMDGSRHAIAHHYIIDLMSHDPSESDTLTHNQIVFGPGGDAGYQFSRNASSYGGMLPWKGEMDYNRWFDPSGTSPTVASIYNTYTLQENYNMSQWQAFSDTMEGDVNDPGKHSTYDDSSFDEVILLKNWSASDRSFPLHAAYLDVDKNAVSGSVTVPAFYSLLLFRVSGDETEADLYCDSSLVPMLGNSFEFELEQIPFYGDVLAKLNFTTSATEDVQGWIPVDGSTAYPLDLSDQLTLDISGSFLEGDLGLSETVLPASVGATYIRTGDTGPGALRMQFSGLEPGASYSFKLFSSCAGPVPEGAATLICTETDSTIIQHGDNASFMAELAYLSPDAQGRISLDLKSTAEHPAYLNALVISQETSVGMLPQTATSNISCYPVPVSNELYISGVRPGTKLRAFDIRGSSVFVSEKRGCEKMRIDMSALPAGIYLFQVLAPDGSKDHFKVVKK